MPVSNCAGNTATNLDEYIRLPIVIKFSYSPKVSWDLNKETTQTRKTGFKLLSFML